ncbi:MIP/aquaporin family protein [Nitrososphaera viennensis]|uniref:Major intrinsic protein n=2 Tax=Nitrososphaera viennensis TaxID=1034015 RepID=A0A060HID5_9ARCH|nr:aquaporin [Nitrososphaera viennensis]AIC16334.1 major intrinsic protein [Nitrososphaera viennensis EN76]UVS68270.1 aquaporin [Nitrososphaera viennensis]
MSETSKKVATAARLASDRKRFLAELAGTFVVVVLATGSVVIDARLGGSTLGTPFAAICPAIAVALMVYAFGKISMAHFNPAVTLGFLITGHIVPRQFPVYFAAEIIGALLASAFVAFAIGTEANLGANAPDYSFPLPLIIAVEVLATALLMAIIYAVVYTKGLKGFSGVAIGGMVGLDILFLSFVSGASMNPARSLAPALLSGFVADLWLYWTATFAGAAMVAMIARKKFR